MNQTCNPIPALVLLIPATTTVGPAPAIPASLARAGETPRAATAPAFDPGRDMVAVLPASGPHAALGEQARLFERFVGTWDCDYGIFDEQGQRTGFSGELLFGWVLDGHAMQDIWIGYPRAGSGAERDIGTTLRIFDPGSRTWRVVWVAASRGYMIQLQGGAEGDRIVLRGQDTDGSLLRWSFADIRADAFVWRGESSRDGGQTWWLQEEHHMRRRPAAR